jgi:hypothetical protein
MDFELAENRSNTIIAVESGALMASFTPADQDCQRVINDGNITNEFIFIVDCSGSMDNENKIGLARQAMLLFLKSLPVDCHFNIIRFGDKYKSLFSDMTTIYNEENARQAEQLINNMKADLGGTELVSFLASLDDALILINHFFASYHLSNGSKRTRQFKVILVKFFSYRTAKFRMSMKSLIYAAPWLLRLGFFHSAWVIHLVVRLSKVLLVQPMGVSFSFHLVHMLTYTSVNNCKKHCNLALPMFE